jgi:hypothetical protein
MKNILTLTLVLAAIASAAPAMSETVKKTQNETRPIVRNESQSRAITRNLDMGALNPQPIPPGHASLGSGPISTRSKAPASKPTPTARWDVSANKGS